MAPLPNAWILLHFKLHSGSVLYLDQPFVLISLRICLQSTFVGSLFFCACSLLICCSVS